MARTRATIQVSVWTDADWRSLPALAKYLYWSILAQSKLSIAGCIDMKVARWAELSPDTDVAEVVHLLGVLEAADYVAIDRETDELVVRTFVKHDVAGNKNSQRGVWAAWSGIESEYLRRVVVHNVPDSMWDNPDAPAPAEALRMRGEPPPERPTERLSERPSERPSEHATEPPVLLPSPVPVPSTAATLDRAARLLAEREADIRGDDVRNRDGYVRSRLAPIRREHEQAWTAALDADPTVTAEQLVTPKPRAVSPLERTAAAAEARYSREEARRANPCARCQGDGQLEDAGRWSPCPACNGSGVAA